MTTTQATSDFSKNPLLSSAWLPHFKAIQARDVEPAIRHILSKNQTELEEILKKSAQPSWTSLVQPLDELNERLSQAWSPVSHLHAVLQSDELRDAYNACLPLITEYATLLMQHQGLFKAVQALAQSKDYEALDFAQKKTIEHALRDFRLAGVHLNTKKKEKFLELEKKLSQLSTKFSENLLDASQSWFMTISDKSQLVGLPESALELAKANAKQRGVDGWVLGLDYPTYSAAMKFLDNRELRQKLYQAYSTRASDQGPDAGKWDNSSVMDKTLACRHELAQLLDFKNYVELSLATKMAKEPRIVIDFLSELLKQCRPFAEKEMTELKQFIKSIKGPEEVASWDLSYYAEKLRQAKYNFSEEEIKPYFPITKVLPGLFALVNKIYGLTIKERTNIETWHQDVKFYDIYDEQHHYRGGFYIDLYARPKKREGAWMDECRKRRRLLDHNIQQPIAYLTCNFTPPLDNKPALLTHDEVLTLFHEFGHCLHHLLTKIDYPAVSGINGVPWDAVEFPSQIMELWFWEDDIIKLISGHYETDEPLPKKLHQQMLAAKNFQSGLHMIRQLEFALFDFRLHLEYQGAQAHFIQKMIEEVRTKTSLLPVPAYNRFQHSFAHIFAGGYAAGYYSYAWADVLSCDAYEQFVEHGLLDRATGESFMQNILEKGGACEPLEAFIAFRGRKPEMHALLKQNGWVEK